VSEIGSLHHWVNNRSEYLTRAEGAKLLHRTTKTIQRYVADGLPIYSIGGIDYVHIKQLRAKFLEQRRAHSATRFRSSQ
jgi:hypothetical protein